MLLDLSNQGGFVLHEGFKPCMQNLASLGDNELNMIEPKQLFKLFIRSALSI